MAFELTINGKTQIFETGAELFEYRERNKTHTPKTKKHKNKKPKTKVLSSLKDKVSKSLNTNNS